MNFVERDSFYGKINNRKWTGRGDFQNFENLQSLLRLGKKNPPRGAGRVRSAQNPGLEDL
jgi:hypothetical protein